MTKTEIRSSLLLLLTAVIWGAAFVAQCTGGDALGPYSFNCIRSFIGGIFLLVFLFLRKRVLNSSSPAASGNEKKSLLIGGILCGIALAFATTAQQLGIYYGAAAGKAGFLTACYIVIVPLLGLFINRRCGWNIWLGVFLTLGGLYLLCINGSFSLEVSDLLILLCAFLFAVQILLVDHFAPGVDGVILSCIEFLVCGFVCMIPMLFIEIPGIGFAEWLRPFSTLQAWIPLLYAGVLSCGVAYTLQIVGQAGLNPTVASLIMSLESVFSVLFGWILLNERLSMRELAGCAVIFCAVIIAQIPVHTQAPAFIRKRKVQ